MRFSVVCLTAALVAGIAASCSEKAPPKEQAGAMSSSAGGPPKAAVAQQPGQPGADRVTIPKGASWTILCREIGGAGHIERARQLRDNLVKTSGMRDWHLLHKEDSSILYHGFYKSYTDAKAKADRAKIDAMVDQQGNRPFRLAHITPLEAADPDGPPEWNLANAKGYWSLQIAAYKDSPDRKQYALDAVRAARQQGIEAYYFHGENMSLVCIGTWPQEAVRVADETVRPGDHGQPKFVLPPLPPGVKEPPQIRGADGQRMHVEAGRNEVVDPLLKELMERYPTMAINGATMVTRRKDPRTGRLEEVADASFPVRIPRDEDTTLLDGGIPLPPPERASTPRSGFRTGAGAGGNGGS